MTTRGEERRGSNNQQKLMEGNRTSPHLIYPPEQGKIQT
jgi:hypothetical protein